MMTMMIFKESSCSPGTAVDRCEWLWPFTDDRWDCRKRKGADEEDEDQGSSGDDDFYDRTAPGKARRPKDGPEVHDAASLFGKKVHTGRCSFTTCSIAHRSL